MCRGPLWAALGPLDSVSGEVGGKGCGLERDIRGGKGYRGSTQIRAASRGSSLRPPQPRGSRRERFH